MKNDKGETTFCREKDLPFAPFIGLDILDDVLGEFHINHVAWASGCKRFLCQSSVKGNESTIRQACASMKTAGWTEDRQCRQSDN